MFDKLFRRRGSSPAPHPPSPPNSSPPAPDPESRALLAELLGRAERAVNAGNHHEALQLLAPYSVSYGADPGFLAAYGVVLYLSGRPAEAIRSLTAVLAREPGHVLALKFLTGAYYQTGQVQDGIAVGQRALALGAADEQVLNALGAMYLSVGDNQRAVQAFEDAVISNPQDLQALANLETLRVRFSASGLAETRSPKIEVIRANAIALLQHQLQQGVLSLKDAEHLAHITGIRRDSWALALNIVDAFSSRADLTAGLAAMLAAICYCAGRNEDSRRLSEIAFELSPETIEIRNLWGARLVRGGQDRWLEGWRLMADTNRLVNPNNYPDTVPAWRGENLAGQRLFVHFDQGVGDAFMTLRFLDQLSARGIDAILWVPPALVDFVKNVPSGIEVSRASQMPDPRQEGCTYSCGLLDLPAALGLTPSAIGAFTQMPVPAGERMIKADPGRLTIGLIAMGNPKRADDWLRSIGTDDLRSLESLEGVRWVNLSVDARPELDVLVSQLGMIDLSHELRSFADTARALAEVDGVIAIDCAAAHLAGALGRPLWILKPTLEDWRWQIGDKCSPWWPAARLFPADGPGQWTEAVKRLVADVAVWRRVDMGAA